MQGVRILGPAGSLSLEENVAQLHEVVPTPERQEQQCRNKRGA
jgi:hypothetical protein